MATEELLKSFNSNVEEYAKHRTYIDRAKAQAHKFSPAVVEKVILDHEIISSEVADRILPQVPELEKAIGSMLIMRDDLEGTRKKLDDQLEELTLRQLIGELGDDDFSDASSSMKAQLDDAVSSHDSLKEQVSVLEEALQRWIGLAEKAGQETGISKPTPVAPPVEVSVPAPAPTPAPAPAPPEILVEESDGSHVSRDHVVEDVSAAFSEPPAPAPEPPPTDHVETELHLDSSMESEAVVAIETDEGGADDQAEIGYGYGDEAAEIELELGGGAPRDDGNEGIDLSSMLDGAAAVEAEPASTELRRALLLYQEGTPEEQIYPFTGDVLTVGRGRDNDIQIKNDSKVSRYHCRVFRRGANFYIEDNKSSNGTLVNAELITERRLFGGEEIIIGETFFRFRIMD